jgi:hypothetical protein
MRTLFRLLAVFGLMVSLSACYVTTGNIIPPERAEALPGLEGNWTTVEGEATDVATIAQVSGTNDYQMTSTAPDAEGQVLLMRGFKLAGDTYAAQVWDQGAPEEGTILVFLVFQGETIAIVATTDDTQAMAAAHGVTLGQDNIELTGDPAAILAFLEDHADAAFTPPEPMMKRVN